MPAPSLFRRDMTKSSATALTSSKRISRRWLMLLEIIIGMDDTTECKCLKFRLFLLTLQSERNNYERDQQ